jgi:hypothetical protein
MILSYHYYHVLKNCKASVSGILQVDIINVLVYDVSIMAKRPCGLQNKTSRSKKTAKRLAAKNARIAARKRKIN